MSSYSLLGSVFEDGLSGGLAEVYIVIDYLDSEPGERKREDIDDKTVQHHSADAGDRRQELTNVSYVLHYW